MTPSFLLAAAAAIAANGPGEAPAPQITVPVMVAFSLGSAAVGAATAWALLVGRVTALEKQREEARIASVEAERRLAKNELECVETRADVRSLSGQHDKLREDLHSMERRILAAITETGASLRRELDAAGALRKPPAR